MGVFAKAASSPLIETGRARSPALGYRAVAQFQGSCCPLVFIKQNAYLVESKSDLKFFTGPWKPLLEEEAALGLTSPSPTVSIQPVHTGTSVPVKTLR